MEITKTKFGIYHIFAIVAFAHFIVIPLINDKFKDVGLLLRVYSFPAALFVCLGLIAALGATNKVQRILLLAVSVIYIANFIYQGMSAGSETFGDAFYYSLGFVPNGALPYFSFSWQPLLSILDGLTGLGLIGLAAAGLFINDQEPADLTPVE